MNSGIQFYDGITTAEIQEILVKSASDLISLEAPNYQFVAARLLLFGLRKQVFGVEWVKGHPAVVDHAQKCVEKGIYDSSIIGRYSDDESNQINSFIDHDRDFLFTYAGLRQVADKYLVQDRSSGEVYETPQYMYMMIAHYVSGTILRRRDSIMSEDTTTQSASTKSTFPHLSWEECELLRQFAKAVFLLMLMTPSILSLALIWPLVDTLHNGRVSVSTRVESGASTLRSEAERFNTQVWSPSSKKFESTVRCCTQNGIRGGSATVHFPIWQPRNRGHSCPEEQ